MALEIVSKERFFSFFAAKRRGEEDGRRGTIDCCECLAGGVYALVTRSYVERRDRLTARGSLLSHLDS